MKRLPSICLLLTIAVTVFAEEQFTSNPQIRLGGHITSQFPAGNMSPYANAAVGLGADVLFFLPVSIPVLRNMGFSFHAQWLYFNETHAEVTSLHSLQTQGGIVFEIPLADSGFSLYPEITYGAAFHFLQAMPQAPAYLAGTYIDQIIEFSIALAYDTPLANGASTGFFIMPVYSIMPEHHALIQLPGFKIGCIYGIPCRSST